ncbi:hypothetical protein GcC1_098016 [Golovinomyces cichoracearum]|uniref:Retrotransposon gag domain-containing protein n=1 Tax=Golovinomyces cichoracearum TaxID=62708 RepID=A0A420IAD8_9PEZI|nr:hypothetical protein GcC1_098016 [Golovinomyces cichoracearum]
MASIDPMQQMLPMLNSIQARMISNEEQFKTRMETYEQEIRDQRARIETWGPKRVEEEHSNPDVRMDEELRHNQVIENEGTARSIAGELQLYYEERSEWISWQTEALTKLRIDGHLLGGPEQKFGYLYMHLQRNAQKRMQQWYSMCLRTRTNCNPEAFLARAESTFGDPNERRNARTLLNAMKQGPNESFSDYITKFEELLAQAGGEGWPQEVQVNALEESLNREMQSRLVNDISADPNYQSFRATCLTIDAKLQAMRMRSKIYGNRAEMGGEKRDIGSSGGGNNRRRAPWASTEERERRRREGLCLRCGGGDHLQGRCRFMSAGNTQEGSFQTNNVQPSRELGNQGQNLIIEQSLSESENV